MSAADGAAFREVARELTGIALSPEKDYFVEGRLEAVARARGLSLGDLAQAVRSAPRGALAQEVAEALLIAETSFFRDPGLFEVLRAQVLPELIAARRAERRLALWSAACATGQEPYSLALLLVEHFPELDGWDVDILATDLSQQALDYAASAVYTQHEVNRGLPARLLVRHFEREAMTWRLRPAVRRLVRFARVDLLRPLPPLPRMDLVLLRNMLIYHDVETKRGVLASVRERLRADGRLVLGSAETTLYLDAGFEPSPELGVYRVQDAPGEARGGGAGGRSDAGAEALDRGPSAPREGVPAVDRGAPCI